MSPGAQTSSPSRVGVDLAQVRDLLEPVAAAHGVRLVDVEWTTAHGGRVLRLTIEPRVAGEPSAAPGSVTLEDCVRVSRDASVVLDVEDPIPQSYSLEVSSPGLDRPLRSLDDFRRMVGSQAKVKLRRPAADGQRVLRGVVVAASAGTLRMDVDGNEHRVPLEDVSDARPVLDFGGKPPQCRKGRRKGQRRAKQASGERRRRPSARKSNDGRHRPASRNDS